MKPIGIVVLCTLFLSTNAQVEAPRLAFGMGTHGATIGLYRQITPKYSAGIALSHLNFNTLINSSLIDQPITLQPVFKFTQASAFLRWHPWGKVSDAGQLENRGFHVLLGMAIRNNSIYRINTTLKETTQIGQLVLGQTQTGSVDVFMHTRRIQPFAGIGFMTYGSNSGVSLGIDVGIFYHGAPETDLEASGTLRLNARNEAQLNKNLQGFTIFPLIQAHMGVSLRRKEISISTSKSINL
ncbi:MAG: hypothetical protein RLY85_1060 [Bacteroidota bacterium]